ncbi:MAG: extracellular solute-binding protein family 1 [Paenibacillaceae bacterium]|nr:extracellular solute-binding protein family 1 [Paenibacillaceae bacterium]
MRSKKGWFTGLSLIMSLGLVLSGCGSSGQSGQQAGGDNGAKQGGETPPAQTATPPKVSTEPVTMSFLQTSAAMTDEEFAKWIVAPVKKKYPNITLNLVRQDKIDKLAEFVTAGNMPDIIYAGPVSAREIVDLKAADDLNAQIKQNNIDIAKFDPVGIEAIQQLADGKEMYALPMGLNFSIMYYNKDIFDKFAVSYPKDGLTWDDAIELAKRVTRTEDGVEYRGLAINGNSNRLGEQLSLPMVDPKTLKGVLQTDKWKLVMQTYQKLYTIPGNYLEPKDGVNAFEKDRYVAMFAGMSARIGELEQMQNQGNPMNWDMATTPTFKEAPKMVFGNGPYYLMQSTNSKHKNEVFAIIDLLTQDEEQTMISKQARRSALKDKKYQDIFGTELASMKGKNIAAVFKMTPAPLPPTTIYETDGFNQVVAAGRLVAKDPALDVNTVLRDAEEKLNKAIEAKK